MAKNDAHTKKRKQPEIN